MKDGHPQEPGRRLNRLRGRGESRRRRCGVGRYCTRASIGRGDDDGGDNIRYHARLCRDAGWIRSVDSEELGREGPVVITELTWAGHDELERLRPKPSRYEDPDATLGHV